MSQVHELLHRAAGDDQPVGFDHDDVRRRVQRRARQRRGLALASALVAIGLTAGAVAWVDRGDRGSEGVSAHEGTVVMDELTAETWVATAFSAGDMSYAGPIAASLAFHDDGTFLAFDGCRPSRGRWVLDDDHLRIDDLERPGDGCAADNGMEDILADDPSFGRPQDLAIGALEMRSSLGFVVFQRFDRVGEAPGADDLVGSWSDDPASATPIIYRFDADGTLYLAPDPCRHDRSWSLDDDLLTIETDDDGDGGTCEFLRVTSHDPWNGSSRARVRGGLLWLDLEGAVMLLRRVGPDGVVGPAPHIGRAGESAKDVAERVATEVLDDPAVAVQVEEVGATRVVTLETGSGAMLRAEVAYDAVAETYRLDRLGSPGLTMSERDGELTVTVPDPGRLLVTGYDGSLSPPGEVFIDGNEGVRGDTDPLAIPGSAWLHVRLSTREGPVLHLLVPR